MNRKYILLSAVLLTLSGCGGANGGTSAQSGTAADTAVQTTVSENDRENSGETEIITPAAAAPENETDVPADDDKEQPVSASIVLSDSGISISGAGAEASGSTLTIKSGGVYEISGSMTGQIIVDCSKDEEAELVLNGVTVNGVDKLGSPLYIKSADKVSLKLKKDTVNTFTDTETYASQGDDDPNACIYSEDDLTIKGSGFLTVNGNFKHGIYSKNDIKIKNGTITVNAAADGIKGKNSVTAEGGIVTVVSEGDSIVSNSSAQGKGTITLSNVVLDITSGGGSANAPVHNEWEDFGGGFPGGGNFGGFGGGRDDRKPPEGERPEPNDRNGGRPSFDRPPEGFDGGFPGGDPPEFDGEFLGGDFPAFEGGDFGGDAPWSSPDMSFDGDRRTDMDDSSSVSSKGIKANSITIDSGTFTLDCSDDAFHSKSELTINGGTFSIKTGDDALHAGSILTVNGGTGDISTSYEGLEAVTVAYNGGEWSVYALDDGVNASSDIRTMPGRSDNTSSFTVSGGVLTVSSEGDGLDSNGDITMSGAEVTVYGTDNGFNSSLDFDGSLNVTGGTLIAGGVTGMAQSPTSSVYGCITVEFKSNLDKGTVIDICDKDGNVLYTHTAARTLNWFTATGDKLSKDGEYYIRVNGEKTDNCKVTLQ